MITVKGAVIREPHGRFLLEELYLAEPCGKEVVVRLAGTGICHTDLLARDQGFPFRLPAVLGHEGAGVVEQIGPDVRKVRPGDRVVLSFAYCETCPSCAAGRPVYCAEAMQLNLTGLRPGGEAAFRDVNGAPVFGNFFGQSSFCTHSLTSESNLTRVNTDVPLELLGPLGCGIQTGAGTVLNVLKPRSGASIAIFGVGPVGLAAVMAARVAGCATIIAIDLLQERLDMALEVGATHAIRAASEGLGKQVLAIAKGGLDCSIDCAGRPEVLRKAVDLLAPGGSCALVGVADRGAEVSLGMGSLLNGRSVRGVMEGDSVPEQFIPQLVELWRAGRLPFDRYVRYFDLEDINEAVAACEAGQVLKAILRPGTRNH
ncbi:MAG TPA: NAD(P)-dependent alcohol dehydrogenase [Dehalococcoidia bacterium]|nr:NAD(P)-dependent alcohol dehydrogenase [Dehalococcoidia bacterium]